MSYLALYRKHRPQSFAELVGQEAIARTLSNAITQSRLAHAYLFTGPRGTGKTSTARILAKSLNCEQGPTVTPCGECANCLAITAGNSLDVHEIDAASNRGIDDIRDLRERARLAPVAAKHKVYIIDEVHMLTQEAFNALLKTLEEPPPNLIFVLATTEPHKVLATIHSRCQRMDFNRIPVGLMADHLEKIAKEEGIRIERTALELISRRSGGGLRDGLSLLDQIGAVYSDQEIGEADVASALGMVPIEGAIKLAMALAERDVAQSINQANDLVFAGFEHQAILRELIEVFRHLALLAIAPTGADIPPSQRADLEALAGRFKKEELIRILDELARGEASLRQYGISPTIGLELALIKLCAREETVDLSKLLARVRTLEERLASWGSAPTIPQSSLPSLPPSAPQAAPKAPLPPAVPSNPPPEARIELREPPPEEEDFLPLPEPRPESSGKPLSGSLDGFMGAIKRISIPVAGLLSSASLSIVENTIVIALPAALEKLLQDPRKRQSIDQALKESFGPGAKVRIELKDSRSKETPKPVEKLERPEERTEKPPEPEKPSGVEKPEATPSMSPPPPPQVPTAPPPSSSGPVGSDVVKMVAEYTNGRIIEKAP